MIPPRKSSYQRAFEQTHALREKDRARVEAFLVMGMIDRAKEIAQQLPDADKLLAEIERRAVRYRSVGNPNRYNRRNRQ